MKFLSKISIFLLTAAIFMSALVVFADNESVQPLEWPYLEFTVEISEKNRLKDTDLSSLDAKIPAVVSTPYFALLRDHPDVTMWTSGSKTSAIRKSISGKYTLTSVDYTLLGYEDYGDPKGMYDQLRRVVDNFEPEGETLYEKLVSIHDYICKMDTYIMGAPYCDSAYGALVGRKSVCEGYAEAFKLLCDNAKIDCILVTGLSRIDPNKPRETHMWNIVRMDDGKWYAVDATWNDAGDIPKNYEYFLVGSDTVTRNLKFSESHKVSYNFENIEDDSVKTISSFEYPELSKERYDISTAGSQSSQYVYGGSKTYHYNFLDDLQKEIYDKMLAAIKGNMPSNSSKTPTPAATDDMVTTAPDETTTLKETTTAETTTEALTTEAETTDPIVTTTSPIDTTVTPPDTTVKTTTSPISTTPEATDPPVSSTNEVTDAPESSTTVITDTTVTETVTESDTTSIPDTTDPITESVTTAPQTTKPQGNDSKKLYDTVTTVVIVAAIVGLSSVVAVFVIRYAKKHKNR